MNPLPETILFLEVDEVLALHRNALEVDGGIDGIREPGLIESAVAMPRQQFGGSYLHEDIPAMAAAYHFHLNKNHAFLDGNKRVAVMASTVFLLANDYRLTASEEDFERLTLDAADDLIDKPVVIEWFQQYAKPAR